jgi:hypothetical protein
LNTIADAFVVTKYLAGEILVVQGDMGDKLFVIKQVFSHRTQYFVVERCFAWLF